MKEPEFDVAKAQRWFAVSLNNYCWDQLEGQVPVEDAADDLVHAAHASCHHWKHAGNVANSARGTCLLANVYAFVRRGPEAVRYATKCVELTEGNPTELEDWDLAFAYDCLARAHLADSDDVASQAAKQRAVDLGAAIAEQEDREVFQQWHEKGPW